jgi:hypothetical protein
MTTELIGCVQHDCAVCTETKATIERLELEALAATLRIENDALALTAMTANRDEYQREADGMAAKHKVERDALAALLDKSLYALEYASDMTKPEGLSGCDCPICNVIGEIEAMKEAK